LETPRSSAKSVPLASPRSGRRGFPATGMGFGARTNSGPWTQSGAFHSGLSCRVHVAASFQQVVLLESPLRPDGLPGRSQRPAPSSCRGVSATTLASSFLARRDLSRNAVTSPIMLLLPPRPQVVVKAQAFAGISVSSRLYVLALRPHQPNLARIDQRPGSIRLSNKNWRRTPSWAQRRLQKQVARASV